MTKYNPEFSLRWYKGIKCCMIVSQISPLKTVKVMWRDGSEDIVPVRMCWHKSKAEIAKRREYEHSQNSQE